MGVMPLPRAEGSQRARQKCFHNVKRLPRSVPPGIPFTWPLYSTASTKPPLHTRDRLLRFADHG